MDGRYGQTIERCEGVTWPAIYEVRVRGHLDGDHWSQWFDGMTVTAGPGGETVIRGPLADQATLYGLLSRLRDLNLPLLLVVRSGEVDPPPGPSGGAPVP